MNVHVTGTVEQLRAYAREHQVPPTVRDAIERRIAALLAGSPKLGRAAELCALIEDSDVLGLGVGEKLTPERWELILTACTALREAGQ